MKSSEAKAMAESFIVDWEADTNKIEMEKFRSFSAAIAWAKRQALKHDRSLAVTPVKNGKMFGGSWWVINSFDRAISEWTPA